MSAGAPRGRDGSASVARDGAALQRVAAPTLAAWLPTADEVAAALGDAVCVTADGAPDPAAHGRALDVRAAALAEGDPRAELDRLRTRRFVRGWERTWETADGGLLDTTVHEFATATDAQRSLDDIRHALVAGGARVLDARRAPLVCVVDAGLVGGARHDAVVAVVAHDRVLVQLALLVRVEAEDARRADGGVDDQGVVLAALLVTAVGRACAAASASTSSSASS